MQMNRNGGRIARIYIETSIHRCSARKTFHLLIQILEPLCVLMQNFKCRIFTRCLQMTISGRYKFFHLILYLKTDKNNNKPFYNKIVMPQFHLFSENKRYTCFFSKGVLFLELKVLGLTKEGATRIELPYNF